MKSKYNKLIQFYMNMTVNKPITVLLVISLGLASVLGLIMAIEAGTFTTYTGVMEQAFEGTVISVKIDTNTAVTLNSRAYWYINRQAAVFDSQIIELAKNDGYTVIRLLPQGKDVLLNTKLSSVKVDLQTGTSSILERLFGKGGL